MAVPSRSEHPSRKSASHSSPGASRSSDLLTIEGILAASRAAGGAHEKMTTQDHPPIPQSESPGEGSAWIRATGERISSPSNSSRVHARLRKARGGAAPRTAFLRSPVARPVRRTSSFDAGARGGVDSLDRGRSESRPEGPEVEHPLGFDPREPLLTTAELDAFFSDPPAITAAPPATDLEGGAAENSTKSALDTFSGEGTSSRPPWLRNQVADLADIVQTLELRARASHSHVGISAELARLRQFTRTIGYVASPPPRGGQHFDVAIHVEEQLGAMVGDKPDAPRLLFRRDGETFDVVADKALVAQAFEAVLRTATACCGAGDVVRVSVQDTRELETPLARVRIEFPRGPLDGLTPTEIVEPYALKGKLAGVGAHALSAAGAIAVGQGGDLRLEEISGAQFAFVVELPRTDSSDCSSNPLSE